MLIMISLAEVFGSCQERFRPAVERVAGQLLANLGLPQASDQAAADKLATALKGIHLPEELLQTGVDRIYLSDTELQVKSKFDALDDFKILKFTLGRDKDALACEAQVESDGKRFYIQVDRIHGLISKTNKSIAEGGVRSSAKRMQPVQQACFISLVLREGDEADSEVHSCPINQLQQATIDKLTRLGLNLRQITL